MHRLVDGLDLKKAMRIERSSDLLDHSWNGEGGIPTESVREGLGRDATCSCPRECHLPNFLPSD